MERKVKMKESTDTALKIIKSVKGKKGWRDGLTVQSTGCSSRRLGLDFKTLESVGIMLLCTV